MTNNNTAALALAEAIARVICDAYRFPTVGLGEVIDAHRDALEAAAATDLDSALGAELWGIACDLLSDGEDFPSADAINVCELYAHRLTTALVCAINGDEA